MRIRQELLLEIPVQPAAFLFFLFSSMLFVYTYSLRNTTRGTNQNSRISDLLQETTEAKGNYLKVLALPTRLFFPACCLIAK
jgi:hypothetical protein